MSTEEISLQEFIQIRSNEVSEELAQVLRQYLHKNNIGLPTDLVRLIHARALFIMTCIVTGQDKTPDQLLREIEAHTDSGLN